MANEILHWVIVGLSFGFGFGVITWALGKILK